MIPLVLNFEALFLKNRDKRMLMLNTGGWIEAKEVTIRVVTMLALLLQIRLLQLVWTSKTRDGNENGSWVGEKKAVFVSLSMYIWGLGYRDGYGRFSAAEARSGTEPGFSMRGGRELVYLPEATAEGEEGVRTVA
ncbi:hypothetical protein BUALT_Bualt18G0051500 [Buddleja alternifolia]|uniref:RING-type E3 ubiquitin transferase n=1 Tax=Buddleja alternifolia TaxID=168488 RepID=A0AAV6W1Y4_9LAMI|nr:hypothetical protein BUALT_Bualt18G0051500 [Buddleja alternifolia]